MKTNGRASVDVRAPGDAAPAATVITELEAVLAERQELVLHLEALAQVGADPTARERHELTAMLRRLSARQEALLRRLTALMGPPAAEQAA